MCSAGLARRFAFTERSADVFCLSWLQMFCVLVLQMCSVSAVLRSQSPTHRTFCRCVLSLLVAKVMNFDSLWEKGTHWHFWEDRSRFTGVPKSPAVKSMKFAATPLVLTPSVPFRLLSLSLYIYIYLYILIHTYIYLHTLYIYIYMYVYILTYLYISLSLSARPRRAFRRGRSPRPAAPPAYIYIYIYIYILYY